MRITFTNLFVDQAQELRSRALKFVGGSTNNTENESVLDRYLLTVLEVKYSVDDRRSTISR